MHLIVLIRQNENEQETQTNDPLKLCCIMGNVGSV